MGTSMRDLVMAVLALATVEACSDRADVERAPEGRASALTSAAAPTAPSASSSRPTMRHEPGTVPTIAPPPTPREPTASPALETPTFTRLRASPTRRAGVGGAASLLDDGGVLVVGPGAVHVVAPAQGDGFAIRTGDDVTAWDATATHLALFEQGGRLTVWDTRTGTLRRSWVRKAPDSLGEVRVVLSPDGARVALALSKLEILEVATGATRFERPLEFAAFGLEFDGDVVGYSWNNAAVQAIDGVTGAVLAEQGFATGGTFGVTGSPDTRWAAGAAEAGHGLQVASMRSKEPPRQLVTSEDCREHVTPIFSRDSRFVYAAAGTAWVKGFETGTWKPYASYHAPEGRSLVGFADDLSRALTTRDDADPRVVRVSDRTEVALTDVPAGTVAYQLSADGQSVLGASEEAVRIWRTSDGALVYTITP